MINEWYEVVHVTNRLAYFKFYENNDEGIFELSKKNLDKIIGFDYKQEKERQAFLAKILKDART